ncbi:uncharacterized protein LOC115244335 [Formica exsecta]|uniref:uncharacterized protein LOC115244335 n=1 Tax=Formica exsecta TaxID=72781 RepID=UPI001142F233|nr:uncharacterized protein LOC115244335 [Formica exsecta]
MCITRTSRETDVLLVIYDTDNIMILWPLCACQMSQIRRSCFHYRFDAEKALTKVGQLQVRAEFERSDRRILFIWSINKSTRISGIGTSEDSDGRRRERKRGSLVLTEGIRNPCTYSYQRCDDFSLTIASTE